MTCKICHAPDKEKPMCFRGEPWCSDDHRKLVLADDAVEVMRRGFLTHEEFVGQERP